MWVVVNWCCAQAVNMMMSSSSTHGRQQQDAHGLNQRLDAQAIAHGSVERSFPSRDRFGKLVESAVIVAEVISILGRIWSVVHHLGLYTTAFLHRTRSWATDWKQQQPSHRAVAQYETAQLGWSSTWGVAPSARSRLEFEL